MSEPPAAKKRKYSTSPNPPKGEIAVMDPVRATRVFTVSVDPFDVDASLARYYLDAFMQNFNALFQIYPQGQFYRWATGGSHKSATDIMLLHVILSLGASFAGRSLPRSEDDGRTFDELVEAALEHERSKPSVQLAQTLLLLSYRRFAKGDLVGAGDTISYTMRGCLEMRLNYERQNAAPEVRPMCPFGFGDSLFDECRRRTFWVVYIMETTMHYCLGDDYRTTDLHCSLRIPCKEEIYDDGSVSLQPSVSFRGSESQNIPECHSMGRLAVYVSGMAILREAMYWIEAIKTMPKSEAKSAHVGVQQRLLERAQRLYNDLCDVFPRQKKPAKEILGQTLLIDKEEPRQAFVLYHFIKMVLYRHVRYDCMEAEQVVAIVNSARSEAFRHLNVLWKLHSSGQDSTACPLAGYALLLAVDITTAAGSVASTMEYLTGDEGEEDLRHQRTGTGSKKALTDLLTCGIEVLADYGTYWQTAKTQLDAITRRFMAVKGEIARNAGHKPGFFFQDSLHSPFRKEADIMYGLDKISLFRALGMGHRVQSLADLYEVKGTQAR
jgi:hypothetical protein